MEKGTKRATQYPGRASSNGPYRETEGDRPGEGRGKKRLSERETNKEGGGGERARLLADLLTAIVFLYALSHTCPQQQYKPYCPRLAH